MTQDFASKKRKRPATTRKSRGKRRTTRPSSNGTWFAAGLLTGAFSTGLLWLALQQPDGPPVSGDPASGGKTTSSDEQDGLRFDFYTLLPQQRVEVDVDQTDIDAARNNRNNDQYLLQAGSFRLEEDADRRRGTLILLGLDARIQEVDGDNGRWYRVYVGPFESRSKLAKARSLTAQQGIGTLLVKQPAPNSG